MQVDKNKSNQTHCTANSGRLTVPPLDTASQAAQPCRRGPEKGTYNTRPVLYPALNEALALSLQNSPAIPQHSLSAILLQPVGWFLFLISCLLSFFSPCSCHSTPSPSLCLLIIRLSNFRDTQQKLPFPALFSSAERQD